MEFKVEGIESREKEVAEAGTSGRIYLPKSWVGRTVVVILKEQEKDETT